ncbi:MAG: hypothetical protein KAS96_01800 [Planctomycetes bacterium]|nr:hypothetical protein [Planctomycetota bacterium]
MRRVNSKFTRSFLLVVLSAFLLVVTFSVMTPNCQAADNGKQIVHKVAMRWIQVGSEQFNRGFYKAAEQSLLRARDYKEYLTVEELEQIETLLAKTHEASLQREDILKDIKQADKLMSSGKFVRAKAYYEKILSNQYLSDEERQLVSESLAEADSRLGGEKKDIAELYNKSVNLFEAGQYEEARDGFIKVSKNGLLVAPTGETAEDYLVKIDNILVKQAPAVEQFEELEAPAEELTEVKEVEVVEIKEVEVVEIKEVVVEEIPQEVVSIEPVTEVEVIEVVTEPEAVVEVEEEDAYIDVINRKRNILKSHTNAVVNDSVAKANVFINEGSFDEAKDAVETAERLVNKNPLHLGDQLFMGYSDHLEQLHDQIEQGKKVQQIDLEEKRRQESIEAQRVHREQMESDRQKRITELMGNSNAYLEQQRYDEALGQLDSLLAIDPLNNNALILKQTLEDTINFREQLELKKESEKQRADLLFMTDEASIPYAKEMTLPKNWREISAKRRPEEAIGQDPANAAVYKQLAETVDLSELTPDTSFSAAIEILKKSVDPALKIVVMWGDLLDNADIEPTTPINMDAVEAIPVSAALDLLLRSVSGGFAELGYSVENGIITIATVYSLPSKLETLVYDITDLLGRRADYRTQAPTGGGSSSSLDNIGGGFQDSGGSDDQLDRDELREDAGERAGGLVLLIQNTIDPESWEELGGEGSITIYGTKKLIVRQTSEIHGKIDKLLEKLRKSLGYQVAIEARFLLVGENFLEDIGLDVDFQFFKLGGGGWQAPNFLQDSSGITDTASLADIPGSLAGTGIAAQFSGGYGGLLDDLMVSFVLRATQAHKDTRALTAPKVTVINGESADLRVQTTFGYAGDIEIDTQVGTSGNESSNILMSNVNYEDRTVTSGTILNVTPIITHDKKHVILNIEAQLDDFLGFTKRTIDVGMYTGGVGGMNFSVEFPHVETSRVRTRVSVPDGGTLLLGGQKLTAETETEAGVPILSKIPIIGRAFNNRSKVKDQRILLILVKPTIILQEEAEAEAIAAMEGDF